MSTVLLELLEFICMVTRIGCVCHSDSAYYIIFCIIILQRWSWKQLKNIMYKEKFIMEIIDNSHSQLKQTISSPGITIDHSGLKKPQLPAGGEAIITHTWYSTPKVVLALWRMAKVQHKFSKGKSTSVRSCHHHHHHHLVIYFGFVM